MRSFVVRGQDDLLVGRGRRGEDEAMPIDPGDYFDLSMDDLREVARYAVGSAEDVLSVFEQAHPEDGRPRAAVDAAWTFVNGAKRTKLQQVTALDAHRAAKVAGTDAAKQPLLPATPRRRPTCIRSRRQAR
jgi:hypothetical protein